MSNSTSQVLMKKGKRGAAAYIHAECSSGSPRHLGPMLDVLLNPSKAIDEWETIDWCRWLLAGGRTPDEFATVIRSYDKHDKCGLVWIPRVVAYRCRTCGISPCMSICRDCFHRGDHSTHDFNMFLSQAGGACDCGDNSVMKEDGFCSNHGNKCPRPGTAPADLLCVAEAMMPRLILRLLQHFRENSCGPQTNSDRYRITVQECEDYVQMLMEFNNMGDLMRGAMTKALINPQMYRNLVEPPFPDTEYGRYLVESKLMYERAINSFPAPDPPDDYRHLPALAPKLQHNTLLDEFIFWTFKYEFPQNVVCFLLNMLPDQDYKEHLTRTFVLHYARIPLVLEAAADPDTLSNRVVHMSVQLFSNEALALRYVQQLHLLHVMVLSLRLMMSKILVKNTLHNPESNTHYVIDCTKRLMKEHCFWPLVSDFNNVLSHKSVALLFLQDDALVEMWFEFLSLLQGMNVNVRETGSHIEFEPSSYYAAFSCELEAAAYPMWSVLGHLVSPAQAPLARRVVSAALTALQEWLRRVGPSPPSQSYHPHQPQPQHASFHYPLHRYLAAFLCAAGRHMATAPASLLPPTDLLEQLAYHPLRVQSLFYEILSGIWVRNGLQIKGQAMTYIQANFCNSMVDMDIYWLQVCAAHLPADQFLNMCIDSFGVRQWLNMDPMTPSQAAEQDSMVEGLLTFLAILVSSRTNLGNSELQQSRLEVSTLLAAADKTHSQLLELMPERSGNEHTRNFETVLKELSTYRPPPKGSENLEQGLFVPKPEVWERYYDPLHVLRRAVHRRDFHASMERFTAYVREKQKNDGSSTSTSAGSTPSVLWPPLRLPTSPPNNAPDPRAICSSGVLHALVMSVLHRGVHRRSPDALPPHAPPDHVLALALYLLRLATYTDKHHHSEVCVAGGTWTEEESVSGRPLLSSLSSGVCRAARTHVRTVTTSNRTQPPTLSLRNDAMDADDQSDQESDLHMRALESGTSSENDDMTIALPSLAMSGIEDEALTVAIPHISDLQRTDSTPQIDYDLGGNNDWRVSLRESPTLVEPSSNQIQEEVSSEKCLLVNESIISLLLKLHSQLSGRLDSFSLDDASEADEVGEDQAPIGDGPHFIGLVLRQLARLDPRCAESIEQVRHALWPHQRERQAEQRNKEREEKEARSRRARERQKQLMAEFARRQRSFMSNLPETDHEDWTSSDKDYHCAICNTTTTNTPAAANDNPIGLCVLLQATSVLGHRRPARATPAALPLSEDERLAHAADRDSTAAAHHAARLHQLQAAFRRDSTLLAVNVGWDGGVHVASCGHTLHLACLRAYLRTLPAPHQLQPHEFLCPVCRQLASAVLPLGPAAPRPPRRPPAALLATPRPPPAPGALHEAMGRAMQDVTGEAAGALRAFRARCGNSPAAILTFVCSLARTSLECELVQRGGTLLHPPRATHSSLRYKPRNDCIVPLLEVIGAHTRVLCTAGTDFGAAETWRQLCPEDEGVSFDMEEDEEPMERSPGQDESAPPEAPREETAGPPVPSNDTLSPVPLLLRDPVALLIQFLMLVPEDPPHMHIDVFTAIVNALHVLTYYQIVVQLCCNGVTLRDEDGQLVLATLAEYDLLPEDMTPQPDDIEDEIQELLLPYLRVCALLRHHLFGTELPVRESGEYSALQSYLCVGDRRGGAGRAEVTRGWVRALGRSARGQELCVRRLLSTGHVAWGQPALLALPSSYERVFAYYHERACGACGGVPKEASVCLACGALLCLKAACCRRGEVCEAVRHAAVCGAGTAVLLAVTSTYCVLLRGRRAALWGSLYLDQFDEEDRDLKRGKPLRLSADRLELLQAQWLAHRFDHTKRTWVWHRDSL